MTGKALVLTEAATQNGNELAQAGAAASAQHEIQSAIIIARKFPRDEDVVFQKLMKACQRPSFAEDARYSFPRGDTDVTGPSVNLAREAARVWGNIRYGLYVVRDDEETRLIRGWAWDVETNTKVELEDDFKKLIQRKVNGSNPPRTEWLVPDERDLRELTNRRGAILLRNALLQVMPKELVEDALFTCGKTLQKAADKDPDAERKRLMVDFGALNISVEQIAQKLGHPFAQSTPAEIVELRGICKSIQDQHSTWAEYVKGSEKQAEKSAEAKANEETLIKGQEALAKQQEQAKKPAETKKNEPTKSAQATKPSATSTNGNKDISPGAWSDIMAYIDSHPDLATLKQDWKKKHNVDQVKTMTAGGQQSLLEHMRKQVGTEFPY